MGRIGGKKPPSPDHRLCIGRQQRRKGTSPYGIPTVSGNNGKGGGGHPALASTLRLQDQPQKRRDSTLETHLPTIRRGTPNASGMAEGDGANRKDQTLDLPHQITDTLCPQAARKRATPVRRLPSTEQNNDPELIPTTTHVGTTGPGPRSAVVHKTRSEKRIPSHSGQGRGRMEDGIQNPIQIVRVPSNALQPNQHPIHLPRHDESHLIGSTRHWSFGIHGRHINLCQKRRRIRLPG